MKRLALVSLLAVGLLFLGMPRPADAHVAVSVGFFYDELSPYGHWVDCSYGDCWVPAAVDAGWQPYSNGEWIYTDYGWTWVSYDPWGGDPYHYGSWAWVGGYGWAWVPGTVWAPAWVTWCYNDGFIGWAPLSPTFGFTATGYFGTPFVAPARNYVIVPTSSFVGVNASTARVSVSRNASLLSQTQKATAFRVSGGVVRNTALPLSRVERASGRSIPRRSISAAKTDPKPISRTGSRRIAVASDARTIRAAYAHRSAPKTAAVQTAPRQRMTSTNVSRNAPHKAAPVSKSTSKTRTAAQHGNIRTRPTTTVRSARAVPHPQQARTQQTRTKTTAGPSRPERSIAKSEPRPAPKREAKIVTKSEPPRAVGSRPVRERAVSPPVNARVAPPARHEVASAPHPAGPSPIAHARPAPPAAQPRARPKEERGR